MYKVLGELCYGIMRKSCDGEIGISGIKTGKAGYYLVTRFHSEMVVDLSGKIGVYFVRWRIHLCITLVMSKASALVH